MTINFSMTNPRGIAGGGDARIVEIGDCELFYSYATLVAFRAPGLRIRDVDRFSNTTARHFREMGCEDFDALDREIFLAGVTEAMARMLGQVKA